MSKTSTSNKRLQKLQAVTSSIILLMMILFQSPLQLEAQQNYQSPLTNTVFGSSDSRLTATIKQEGNKVTMTVGAVGLVIADAFEFNVLFHPDSLKVTDSDFNPIVAKGTASLFPSIYDAVRIEPALRDLQFTVSPSTAIRDNSSYIFGGTGHSEMHAIDAHIWNWETSGSTFVEINSTEFVPLYTIFFEKENDEPLTPDAIGFNIRTAQGSIRNIRWIYEGGSVAYDKTMVADEYVNPNLFSFRSPSSVQTKTITDIAETVATFHGMFKRGDFPPAYNLIDSVANPARYNGKLLNDSIVRYGFFYTESDMDISFTEYSDSITIDGINYPFPDAATIAQGFFVVGTDTIKIVETGNVSSAREADYADTVTGLKSNSTYYVWAYAQYVFETSKAYPIIGVKQVFSTSQILNIASAFVATDPDCGQENGAIQVHVIGGSGLFQYSLDGENYSDYPGGLITDLGAGSYRIYVRDALDTLYPAAVSGEIILRDKGSDLIVSVAATHATDCTTEDGILHVSVNGGSGNYIYTYGDGSPAPVVNGQITGLPAGVYVLNVTDDVLGGCSANSGEIHIETNNSTLAFTVNSVGHAECGENTGTVAFTVTGSDYYSYQFDGMSVITVTTNDQIVLSGLNAGEHTLRVFDTCGNETSKIVYIYNVNANGLVATAEATNILVACDDSETKGSILVTASNGTGDYEYTLDGKNWVKFDAGKDTVTVSNLSEGIYYVQVRDDIDSCTYEVNTIVIKREVIAPLNILAVYTSQDPTCGQPNGSIQIHATGGSENYTYEYSVNGMPFVSAPATNGVISNLEAGTYRIRVYDADYSTCAPALSEEIVLHNIGTNLAITVAAVDASTCGTTGDGILYVSANGGSGHYSYLLNGIPVTPIDGKISNRPVGVYVVTVIDDDNNCRASSSEVRISSSDSQLALEVTDSSNTVCGSSVGTAIFKVSGSQNYSYQLDNYPVVSVTHNNPIILSNLNAGVHTLRVFDDCAEITRQIVITNGDNGLEFAAVVEHELVNCDKTVTKGSIILTASNGIHDYQYTIDGNTWKNFDAGKDTVTISELSNGTYYVQVKDASGCTYEMNAITINREFATTLNVLVAYTVQDPTCNTANGSIQIHVTGGSGSYKYSYATDGGVTFTPSTSTNGLITGLSAGSYRIKVEDALYTNCAYALSEEVILHNIGTNLEIAVAAVDASTCDPNNGDGILYVSVNGGSGDYSYTLNGTTVTLTNGKIEDLSVGIYIVEVKDNQDNCIATSGEVRISSSASQLAVEITETTNTICGSSVGTATFKVSGSSNYSYQLGGRPIGSANHSNPILLSNLNAGVHTLRVFDDCAEITTQIVIANGENGDGLAFTVEVENEKIACNGDIIPGNIALTVTNGVHDLQYTTDGVNWKDFAAGKDTVTIFGLSNGSHYVQVKDAADCIYEWNSITIERERLPLVNVGTIIAATDPTNCTSNDGKIQIHATGGSGEYKYSTDGITYTAYTDGLITGLSAGTYRIYVKDAIYESCQPAMSDVITLVNPASNMIVILSTDSATTCESTDGILYVSVSGGSPDSYSYKLNGITVSAPVDGKYYRPAGVYVLEVSDGQCSASSGEARIHSKASNLAIVMDEVTHTVCESSIGTVKFTVSGATSYNYQLDGMPVVAVTNNDPVTLSGLSAGVHTLRVFNNCGEVSEQIIIQNGQGGLAFIAEVSNMGCATTTEERSIVLTVTDGTAPYQYSIDNGNTWSQLFYTTTIVIDNLLVGTYSITLRDGDSCQYEYTQIRIEENGLIAPPSATTPQIFCEGATVSNLQATGTGIKWYLTQHGGIALDPSTVLDSGRVYYAAQSTGACESKDRTAVKVFIDNNVVLDAPVLVADQKFCVGSTALTLADIATNGNTNIVWYDDVVDGNILPISTQLENGKSYFAALTAGNCQSVTRAEVRVTFTADVPDSVDITSPQYFCRGALIADIAVPNNQLVWYTEATGGDLLTQATALRDGVTYYAAYKTGGCESTKRTAVTIYLSTPLAPTAPPTQTICGAYKQILADLVITGYNIVWYDGQGNILSSSTPLVVDEIYYAAQVSGLCESDRVEIRITDDCFTLKGTMFPFVHTDVPDFDSKFPVTVKLYAYPTSVDCDNPLTVLSETPVIITTAKYHDGSEWIPNTPKYPGSIGTYDNPGLPIKWDMIGKTTGTPDNRILTPNEAPNATTGGTNIGWYEFSDVAPGDYLLVISRPGFITRIAKITVNNDVRSLGHRELIAGDVNDDFMVDPLDASTVGTRFSQEGDTRYQPKYDMNGDAEINGQDLEYTKTNNSARFIIYEETYEWLIEECE